VHGDDRGSFAEAFRGAEFAADLGYQLSVAQVNCSVSRRGVIRGIHYSDVPPGQAKYVTCVSGAVLDVVVDLRVGSPGFGEQATVLYLCSTPYAPGREHGVHPLDPTLGIAWPLHGLADAPILSDKDAAAPALDDALRSGALPAHEDCAAYTARLRSALA
jgi:dTDP-4-dehydrorhamnose 3,5-epimerase